MCDGRLPKLELHLLTTSELAYRLSGGNRVAVLGTMKAYLAKNVSITEAARTRRYAYTVTENSSLLGLPGPFEADEVLPEV